eukprot:1157695-Pelagomonas_calceolata.AAC.3
MAAEVAVLLLGGLNLKLILGPGVFTVIDLLIVKPVSGSPRLAVSSEFLRNAHWPQLFVGSSYEGKVRFESTDIPIQAFYAFDAIN